MIDPRNRRRPTHPASIAPPEILDIAEVVALHLELAPLRALPWEPLQVRFEALTTALHGGEGCSVNVAHQLRRWAGNWSHLNLTIRAFYEAHAEDRNVSAAIWFLLDGHYVSGVVRGFVTRLWTDIHGCPPDIDIFPRPAQPAPRFA